VTNDRKHKSTDKPEKKKVFQNIRRLAARQAYSRHDNGEQPQDDVSDDVPPDHLQRLKVDYYEAHMVVDQRKRSEIEQSTRGQSMDQNWYVGRRELLHQKLGQFQK